MNTILDSIKINPNIPNRCYNTAKKSDDIFKEILSQYNVLLEKTENNIDMYDHIDYYLIINGKKLSVDIKSSKKTLNTINLSPENEWVWIEFKNVQGKSGWLYGKADFIVYVFNDQLWFINRKKLITLLDKFVVNEIVLNAQEAKYKLYKRLNRSDLVTQVNLKDIKEHINPPIIHKI